MKGNGVNTIALLLKNLSLLIMTYYLALSKFSEALPKLSRGSNADNDHPVEN